MNLITPPLSIQPARRADMRSVLRQCLATPGQSAAELEVRVSALLTYARRVNASLDRSWWFVSDDQRRTACACIESPGRTAVLLLPHGDLLGANPKEVAAWLRLVVASESTRSLRFLQCLIEPEDRQAAEGLRLAGFYELATLLYMEKPVSSLDLRGPREPEAPGGLLWVEYSPATHGEFALLIAATYEATLDCPGLCGLRSIEDVIAGHRGAGIFNPRRWQILRVASQPVGCILLVENALRKAMDIAYLGVARNLRGRGWGRRLLHRGLEMTYVDGFSRVTVAVDASNAPARRLYEGEGFTSSMSRRAMIHVFDSTSGRV